MHDKYTVWLVSPRPILKNVNIQGTQIWLIGF